MLSAHSGPPAMTPHSVAIMPAAGSIRRLASGVGRGMSVGLALVATLWSTGSVAVEADAGPRQTFLDAGYQWTDVNYGIKQNGGTHEGLRLNGSLGLAEFGKLGVHLYGEYFNGDFTGVSTTCGTGPGRVTISGDRNSESLAAGLGLDYPLAHRTRVVARAAWVDIIDFEVPNSACQLLSADDHGYLVESLLRSELSDRVEIEAGVRHSELSDSDIGDTSVLLGISYHLTDYLTLRARGTVFDDDAGLEIGARFYFGSLLGRDYLF